MLRHMRVVLVLVVIALSIFTLIDCARTDSSSMPSRISKTAWLLLIFLIPVIGPMLWLYFSNQQLFARETTVSSASILDRLKTPHSTKSTGSLAPDDDPEFLARLEAQNRRRAYEQRRREESSSKESVDPSASEESSDSQSSDSSTDHTDSPDEPGNGLYGGRL